MGADTVDEAELGLSALNTCIDLLDKFYKTQQKNTVDLSLAQAPADDAPGAGFEIGQAYTGAQSEAGGILGMLDIMKSDFERTISETQKAEAQAEQDHLEFMTQTGKSLAEKEEAKSQATDFLNTVQGEYSSAQDSLTLESDTLQGP